MKKCICEWCKKEFETFPSRPGRFCSRQCASEYGSKLPRGHVPKPERGGKVTWYCKQCGKEMYTFRSRVRDTCSRSCGKIYSTPKTVFVCQECGKEKAVTPNHMKLFSPRFCSVRCAGKYHTKKMIGAGNPNWRGGISADTSRGSNWGKQSTAARRRDNYRCQNCGELGINVHHIKPYRTFKGDWESANVLSNLITLCISCHSKIEHGKIPCPKPKA